MTDGQSGYSSSQVLKKYQEKIILKTDANDCFPIFSSPADSTPFFNRYAIARDINGVNNINTPSTYRNWTIESTCIYSQQSAFKCIQEAINDLGELYIRYGTHSSSETEWTWAEWIQK